MLGFGSSSRWLVTVTVTVVLVWMVAGLPVMVSSPHSNPAGGLGMPVSVTVHSARLSMPVMVLKPGEGNVTVTLNEPDRPQSTWKLKSPDAWPLSTALTIFRLPGPSTLKLSDFVQSPGLRSATRLATTLYSPPLLLVVSNGKS